MGVTATVVATQMRAVPALLWEDTRVGVSTDTKAMATSVQVGDKCPCIDVCKYS